MYRCAGNVVTNISPIFGASSASLASVVCGAIVKKPLIMSAATRKLYAFLATCTSPSFLSSINGLLLGQSGGVRPIYDFGLAKKLVQANRLHGAKVTPCWVAYHWIHRPRAATAVHEF